MSRKAEEIKVRVEPSKKLALEEMAERDNVPLSHLVRRALGEFISKEINKRNDQPVYANT